jgi:hypothetical protein
MKKSIFLAVIGSAIGTGLCDGQGFVVFSSYAANNGAGATTSYFLGGPLIGIPFQAELYYAIGTVSDPVNESVWSSIISLPSPAFTLYTGQNATAAYDNSGVASGAAGLGYFDGGQVVIPGYTGGPITFEIEAFNGTTIVDSTIRGRSGSFTMTSISTDLVSSFFGDNGQPMPDFVLSVPEPTTLALTVLGGLVSLAAFRRKES